MSEVIREESGGMCRLFGRTQSFRKSFQHRQPAATVIASPFNEVISIGKRLLRSDRFQVYGNNELIGVELAGFWKTLSLLQLAHWNGMGYGENARGLLIQPWRGWDHSPWSGAGRKNKKAFLGVAGIGDLVATCNSPLSPELPGGLQTRAGMKPQEVLRACGWSCWRCKYRKDYEKCADDYKVRAPITSTLYKVLFEDVTVKKRLITWYAWVSGLNIDIDFIDWSESLSDLVGHGGQFSRLGFNSAE